MSHSIICDITQHYSTPVASIITMQSIWIKFHHLISGQPLKLSISCHKIWVFIDLLMIIHNGWVISQKKIGNFEDWPKIKWWNAIQINYIVGIDITGVE